MSTDAPLVPDLDTLPDDPAVLKQLVVQLLEEVTVHGLGWFCLEN